MIPAARISAAIEVLDAWLSGRPLEKALTDWARSHRFAGSGDRAAIRDHVFDAIRCQRSAAWAGGADTGRGLMLGLLRNAGTDPAMVFTGEGHAPPPLGTGDQGRPMDAAPQGVRLDCPDWLLPRLHAALGAETEAALRAGQTRAPTWLRVNTRRASRPEAAAALAEAGIDTRPHSDIATALEVTANARKVSASAPYVAGLVELQDASSQAVVNGLGDLGGLRVLDFCAGAGGKSLHLAAAGAEVTAHDVEPARMRDLGPRAARAGTRIDTALTSDLAGTWPLVLVDAPCSGSGTWRRDPQAKWRLTPQRLSDLSALQTRILVQAATLTAPGGRMVHVTCSMLPDETLEPAERFLAATSGWQLETSRLWRTGDGGDGFSMAVLRRIAED